MKKVLGTLLAVCTFLGVGLGTAYASDCLEIQFDNGDSLCLDIEKNGSNFDVSVANNNLRKNSSILCYITLPNNIRKTLNACRGSFSYNSSSTDTVIVSAMYQQNSDYIYSERFSTKINFRNGSWVDSRTLMNYSNSKNSKSSKNSRSSSNYNDGDLELSTNKSSPSTNQYVNLTINTDRDYYGKLTLSAKYRSSSNGSRSSISNTSSTYFSSYSDEWEDGYYKMKSSDKGKKTLSNLLKFKKSGYYRIYVKDTDGNESYIQFNVDTSSSSSSSRYDNDDLEVSVSPSNPDTNEWVKLTIETDDDYAGKINFSKFQYRSSNSSSWSNISRTSSTYVSDYSDEWEDGYYKMTYSDDGEKSFSKFIKFKKAGYYRIYVKDTDDNESYVQINVDTSSSSSSSSYNDDIELSTNRKSPSTSQYVNLTIETDDDYVGRLSLSAKYRKSSSDSWSSISNTSSTYFTDYSDEWENGFYRMTSDDDGEVTLGDLVKFKKAGYYRIYVEDYDGNESYIQFDVNAAGSSNDNDELKVSVYPSNADTYEWIDLTVKTDADYDARIKISKLQYRSSNSSSWSNISNITSSTYVSDYSDAWSNSYRRIVTDEDGEATLRDIVKFKKAGYYRIYVEDTDNNESYVQVNVDTSSSSSSYNDDIELSTNRKSPSTSQYVNLTIETDEDYTGKLSLSAKYRKSSSDSWSSIFNTSSTYFTDYSDEWEDGYYRMTYNDDGEVTLGDLVKFRKSGYYRIYVKDTDGNESYIEFDVDTAGSSNNNDELKVSVYPSNADTYEWIDLTVKTDADYDARIKISKFQYRSSSSSSWSNISNITSSTYISDYSDAWSSSFHRIVTDEDGEATLRDIVKFKKAGYYRIYVEDTDDNESYVQVNVDTSSSSSSSSYNDEIELSTNRKSPSTSQYVNLTIETDRDYYGKLYFTTKYRSSSNNSWSNISNTSSTYFTDYSDEWEDGYYRMTSSDRGEVTLNNLVKFRKEGYYRVSVIDTDGNESYIEFTVGDADDNSSSSVKGFTSKELSRVKSLYKNWNDTISQLKKEYPSLKRDSYWIELSEDLYDNMKDVINNRSSREFRDYDDFETAFNKWYKYTYRNR